MDALRWIILGIAIGLAGTAFAVRMLRGMLFHVPAENPLLFGAAAGLLLAVAPSLGASRIDPVEALRRE